jgi:hypothetical protein
MGNFRPTLRYFLRACKHSAKGMASTLKRVDPLGILTAMVSTQMMHRFLPFLIGAGLLTLIAVLLLTSSSNDPSRPSIPARPPGTSALSHGGPGPTP